MLCDTTSCSDNKQNEPFESTQVSVNEHFANYKSSHNDYSEEAYNHEGGEKDEVDGPKEQMESKQFEDLTHS